MALNASIFGNMLNAPKSPEEYAAERENLLAARQTNVLNRQKADEYTKGVARQGEFRNLLKTDPSPDAMRRAGFLDEALAWEKNAAIVAKDKAAAAKDTNDANLKTWQAYRDQSSMIRNPQEAAAWITRGYNDPVIGPFLQRFGSLEEGVSRIPTDPAGFEQWRMGVGSNVDKMAEHAMKQQEFGLKANNELIGPDGKPNNTIIGVKTGLAKAGAASTNVNVSTGQKGFDNELKLRDDFKQEPVYKAHQAIQSAHSTITQSLKAGTPAGDLAGATKFMKILDENSVVRESELGMAMAATGLLDRVQNYANSIINGNKLTPKQRQEFQQLADAIYGESVKAYNSKRGEYTKLGAEYGLNADRAIGGPASLAAKPVISAEDQQAAAWANANPNDPRAAKIKQKLGM